jgi:hypothetical protein
LISIQVEIDFERNLMPHADWSVFELSSLGAGLHSDQLFP